MTIMRVFCLVMLSIVCASGVRIYNVDDIINDSSDVCNYYASISDLQNTGLVSTVSDQCKQIFGKAPNNVEVNDDTYPYKLCLVAETSNWSNLQPVASQSVVATDSFNNTTNQNVSHTFSLSGSYANSLQVSTTNTVSFAESVIFNVDIPTTFSMKFEFNSTFTSTKATTQSTSISETYDSSTNVECFPHCDYSADLNVQTMLYKATFEVPICMTGYVKCAYSDRVNGHYWWYVLLDDFVTQDQRCAEQNGVLASAISVDSSTTLNKECYAQ